MKWNLSVGFWHLSICVFQTREMTVQKVVPIWASYKSCFKLCILCIPLVSLFWWIRNWVFRGPIGLILLQIYVSRVIVLSCSVCGRMESRKTTINPATYFTCITHPYLSNVSDNRLTEHLQKTGTVRTSLNSSMWCYCITINIDSLQRCSEDVHICTEQKYVLADTMEESEIDYLGHDCGSDVSCKFPWHLVKDSRFIWYS